MSRLADKAKNYVAEKVANMKKPEATLNNVDLKKVSREGLECLAKVTVDNPYVHPLPICEIDYNLKSAGRVIASGKIPDPGSLKANGQTVVDVPVKVPHGILVSLVRDIATDWDIDYELEVKLIIDIPLFGDFTVPLSTKGEMKLPSIREYLF